MRDMLKLVLNQRQTFIATFKKYGAKTEMHRIMDIKDTMLFVDVKNNKKEIVADHIWFNRMHKCFIDLDLQPGDTVQFNATVKEYFKGKIDRWTGPEVDYTLTNIRKAKIVRKT